MGRGLSPSRIRQQCSDSEKAALQTQAVDDSWLSQTGANAMTNPNDPMVNMMRKKMPSGMTRLQEDELRKCLNDFRFIDDFLMKAMVACQRRKDPMTQARIREPWEQGRRRLEYFAQQANLIALRRTVDDLQRMVDDIILGKIKVFDEANPLPKT
jgi:hypothetical protein